MPPENFENNLPLIFEGNNEESSESSSDSESDYQLDINSRAPLFNNSIFVVSYIDGLWAPDIYKYYILIVFYTAYARADYLRGRSAYMVAFGVINLGSFPRLVYKQFRRSRQKPGLF